MADEQIAVPPLPETGEIVSTQAIYATQVALYRNMLAFSGSRDPSMIWSSMVRDDGSAMIYYRELEEKDPDVANALDTLKGNVIERKHSITPGDSSSLAVEVAEFIEDQIYGIPNFEGVLDNLLDAPGYGFSVAEMVFDVSMGQASLLDIKDCPQELFLFGNRFEPQIGQLQFLSSPYASNGALVPENKFLVFSHRMRSRNRMGRPLLRSVFWSSWFKRNVQTLWMQYAEKGPGTVVVRYQDSANDADKQNAANIAQMLRESAALAVPQGFEYDKDLLTLSRSLDPAVYEHLFEAMQMDIIRRILGETLTSFGGEKGKGTQALGEVHSDTLEKKVISLCKAAANILNQQLIRPLVLWNYGPGVPLPRFGWEIDQPEDLDKKLNRDKVLQGMGVPYPLRYLQETYEVPAPEAGEAVAAPAQNAAGAPAVPDSQDVTFASEDMRRSAQERRAAVERELHQFETLMDSLKGESTDLMRTRVQQIAQGVAPGPAVP